MDRPIDQSPPTASARSAANLPATRKKGASGRVIDHPVLSRLMDEVRNEKGTEASYDRVHHRHNRGR